MRLFRYLWGYAFVALIRFVSCLVDAARYCLRAVPFSPTLHVLPPVKLIAVRIISRLKPAYRESYETHGLSLMGTMARC